LRVLFTFYPTFGNLLPLTPFARRLVEAGHDVAFAAPSAYRATIERFGFRSIRAGIENDDPELSALRTTLFTLRGPAMLQYLNEEIFAGIRPRRMVPELLALAETWRPDLVVHDSREFSAPIAAELLAIPHAMIEVHAAGFMAAHGVSLLEPFQRARVHFGLPARPALDLLHEHLVLAPFPPALHAAEDSIAPTVYHIRSLPDDENSALPAWLYESPSRPLVYASLGTVVSAGPRGARLFPILLDGLREVDAEVVVTLGNDVDPAALGPQPSHIHLERFLPLQALLPRCALALFHGGSGTLGHAVANGLPMVILPISADQPDNAHRCADLGVSRTLDWERLTPQDVSEAVRDVLHAPSYRERARRLRDDFDGLPGPEIAISLLERLAKEGEPLIAPQMPLDPGMGRSG
jgi:UDP:flavonoid glycosyltransferase YjiC (YdhE family)